MPIHKIISGCQTGADRAGLDAAKHLGLETGGTCTKGNRTDEGNRRDLIPVYGLREHSSWMYSPRTEANVLEADGTVLFGNMDSPGSKLTLKLCKKHEKPCLTNPDANMLKRWIEKWGIQVLNVAGNRERTNPGIYDIAYNTIVEALQP